MANIEGEMGQTGEGAERKRKGGCGGGQGAPGEGTSSGWNLGETGRLKNVFGNKIISH